MKKKVFFILSSLNAGGAERVFWLLSQHFDKTMYEVKIVLLNADKTFFSQELKDISIIDLKTGKASLSFFKLYRLIKKERPYAVYTTGGQINALLGFISLFVSIPRLIARPTNVAKKAAFTSLKGKIAGLLSASFYHRFDRIVCQSEEIKASLQKSFKRDIQKMVIIPNPVCPTAIIKEYRNGTPEKRLIVVARLARQKGHQRLLEIFNELPSNYRLTIAGDGPLRDELKAWVQSAGIENRVNILGLVSDIPALIARHDLFVLPSFIEGFPNAVIESLSVGIPVVSFRVGGISALIKPGFNGYIIEQGDKESFKSHILKACTRSWEPMEIKDDVNRRFSIDNIALHYQKLMA